MAIGFIATTGRSAARRSAAHCCLLIALLFSATAAFAVGQPEYRVKAAFLYNFALLTQWPDETSAALQLCVHGDDPFGAELDGLRGKPVGARSIVVRRGVARDALAGCQLVFVPASAIGDLPRVLDALRGSAALTVADSPGAARRGVAVNLVDVGDERIGFEINLRAAQAARLVLSSKLLRLAREVQP
jgi:hypothetical protein